MLCTCGNVFYFYRLSQSPYFFMMLLKAITRPMQAQGVSMKAAVETCWGQAHDDIELLTL